jgi:hypothetical protein
MSRTYAASRLDGELDPEEDADDFDELALEPDELSELAWEVELFEQPVAVRPAIKTNRSRTRIVDMAMNSLQCRHTSDSRG